MNPRTTSPNQKQPRFFREFSAGGMVFRRRGERLDILLIQDSKGRWTIPKGHIEKKEKMEEAAIREIGEETGLTQMRILDRLDKIHFFYRRRGRLIFMTTYLFLIEAEGDEKLVPEDNEGITDVRWFEKSQALDIIAYKDTARLFHIGLRKLQNVRS